MAPSVWPIPRIGRREARYSNSFPGRTASYSGSFLNGRISVEAFDNVNNSSGTYILNPGIISENDKPEIDITVGDSERRTSDDEKLFTEDASVRVVIKDKQSGLQSWTVNIDSEASGGNQQSLITQVTNEEHKVGDVIGDGWLIEEMDANLITSVSKTFVSKVCDSDITDKDAFVKRVNGKLYVGINSLYNLYT